MFYSCVSRPQIALWTEQINTSFGVRSQVWIFQSFSFFHKSNDDLVHFPYFITLLWSWLYADETQKLLWSDGLLRLLCCVQWTEASFVHLRVLQRHLLLSHRLTLKTLKNTQNHCVKIIQIRTQWNSDAFEWWLKK